MSVGAAEILPGGGGLGFLDLGGEIAARSPLALFWRRFRQDRVALASLAFIALLIVLAIAAPLVVELLGLPGPYVQNPNLTDAFGSPLGPSLAHPFGVDQLGQDVMSRVIYGTRVSLEVGILGTAVATFIGVVVGVVAGFYRGWLDTLLSRLMDVMLSIPILLLGLGIGCGLRGEGLPLRDDPARPGRDHLHRRARQLAVHRPHRSRPRAVAARARVHRGVALARCLERRASCSARSSPISSRRSSSTRAC